jgi:cell division protein FtsW
VTRVLRRLEIPDLVFFAAVLALAGLGLVMVYSASSVVALERYGDSWYYLKRQAVFLLGGFFCLGACLATDYHRWIRSGGWLLGAAILSLVLLHVPGLGVTVGGALRWLNLGGFRFQPSEFAKLACIIYMSWALVRKGDNVRSFTYGLLPMVIVAGVLAGLCLTQPDFGNAVLLALIAGAMIYLAGGRMGYLLGLVLLSAPIAWSLIMGAEYRKRRLLSFLNPWEDPLNSSYQIVQSFTAFFSGGLWGRGLGNSQEKLFYLPEVHTDFVAAVIGEELGFIGITALILCYLFLVLRGYRIAARAADRSGFLLAAGCTTLLGLQALLNLCVVMGLLPTKGLPLPLVSHGGSSLMVTFIACGLILSVGRGQARAAGEESV